MTDSSCQAILSARGVALLPEASPFDLDIYPGTILGIAGLEGNGQSRFLEILAGLQRPEAGEISTFDETFERGFRSERQSFSAGIAYVPRNRKVEGLFLELPVLTNFSLPILSRLSRAGVIDRRRVTERYQHYAHELGITASSPAAPIRTLSGGNQQKVLLARWLAAEPEVLLLNDPARGVDHSTKLSLQGIYRKVADRGAAVVLLSTEIEELLLTADEVVVFRHFEISGRLSRDEMSRQSILAAMFGADDVD